jgi:hypothetical protein
VYITGKYKKIGTRPRGDTPEVVNQRWLEGRGTRRAKKGAQAADVE